MRCFQCKKPLTAAAPHGRSKQYPRYWCWQKGCNAVSVSKEALESQFVGLLDMMQPTAELIARLPQISAANWELRKKRVAQVSWAGLDVGLSGSAGVLGYFFFAYYLFGTTVRFLVQLVGLPLFFIGFSPILCHDGPHIWNAADPVGFWPK